MPSPPQQQHRQQCFKTVITLFIISSLAIYFIIHSSLSFSLERIKQQSTIDVMSSSSSSNEHEDRVNNNSSSPAKNDLTSNSPSSSSVSKKHPNVIRVKSNLRHSSAVDAHSKQKKFSSSTHDNQNKKSSSASTRKEMDKNAAAQKQQLNMMNDLIARSKHNRGRVVDFDGDVRVNHFIQEEERKRDEKDDVNFHFKEKALQIDLRSGTAAAREAAEWSEFHKQSDRLNGEALQRELERLDLHNPGPHRRPYEPLIPEICPATESTMRKIPEFTRFEKSVRPKIALLTLIAKKPGVSDNSTRRSQMAKYSFLNKLLYCREHGYDLIIEGDTSVDHSRAPAWSKIRALRRWLPLYEWVVWLDMDTIIVDWNTKIEDITNKGIKKYRQRETAKVDKTGKTEALLQDGKLVPTFKRDIDVIVTQDWNGLNSGVMFWRNCSWSLKFLKTVWSVPQRYARPYWDQGALTWLLGVHRTNSGRDPLRAEADKSHFWYYDDEPRSFFNSYPANFISNEENIDMNAFVSGRNMIAHFPSCRFFSTFCIPWFQKFFNKSLCQNDGGINGPEGWDAPDHYYPPGPVDESNNNNPKKKQQQDSRKNITHNDNINSSYETENNTTMNDKVNGYPPPLPPLVEIFEEDISRQLVYDSSPGEAPSRVGRLGGVKMANAIDSADDFARRLRKERFWMNNNHNHNNNKRIHDDEQD